MSLIECPVAAAARRHPNTVAIRHHTDTISYHALHQLVQDRQRALPSGVVTCIPDNPIDAIITLFAAFRNGQVAALVNPKLPTPPGFAVPLSRGEFNSPSQKGWQAEPDGVGQEGWTPTGRGGSTLSRHQLATILWTSGSTDTPKAAVHTLGNHLANAESAIVHNQLEKGDSWLLNLGLHHVSGLSIVFRCLLAGATIEIPSPTQRPTHMSVVLPQLLDLIQSRPKLKYVLAGGGPISESVLQNAQEAGLPIHPTYGLTEMSSQVATPTVLPGHELRIQDGDIQVRGNALFKGYLSKSDDGTEIMLPLTYDGWFCTGDLGYLDAQGHLQITGRKDCMFISGGENIQPEEIERHLAQHPDIIQAIVVAVPHPKFGHRPFAFVSTRSGQIDEEAIQHFLRDSLPKYKVPDRIVPIPEELRQNSLKLSRKALEKIADFC